MSASRLGVVSVVIINYRGADDTITCLTAFADIAWPGDRLELICVDNASGDGSVERIRAAFPSVKLVESSTNCGFAGGCNLGVEHATGEYVAFINSDARPHREWITAAVDVLERDSTVACVASKVLDWDGQKIDYVDGSLTWFGMGYKREVLQPDSPTYDTPKDVLFATGAAMFVRSHVFREVGGFDERFFMFYEDVDLGWRLNLLGYRVRYEPCSLAFHRHHGSISKFGSFREQYLLERNALISLYKNFEDSTLAKVFPAAMALSVRRSVVRGGDDPHVLDLQRRPGQEAARIEVSKTTLTGPLAIDYWLAQLPSLRKTRAELQKSRVRTDRELMPLFRHALEPAEPDGYYLAGYRSLVEAFGIEEHFSERRRIVIATGEPLMQRLAGPAIRVLEMARVLSEEHEVVVASLGGSAIASEEFTIRAVNGRGLRKLEGWCDVFVFQGLLLDQHPWLLQSKKALVVDVYDPFHLEVLEQNRYQDEAVRQRSLRDCVSSLNRQLIRGDFFLCASPKQRDFWLGQLAALGRINPQTYDSDETLANLIEVVPFGIADAPPRQRRHAIKGAIPGIGFDDKVILWGGGIYNWFDPLTLIRAVDRLRRRCPEVRLFFMGLRHPNPGVPEMRMAVAARALSDSLALTDKHVFFNEGWVAYEERQDYLLDADVGVSCHLDHVETAFSFRTRILDYLWAGLPVVTTRGDTVSDIIEDRDLGITVAPGDVEGLERALFTLLVDNSRAAQCRKNVSNVAAQFRWSSVLAPLSRFCREPRRAADLRTRLGALDVSDSPYGAQRGWRADVEKAKTYLRTEGPVAVGRRVCERLRRRVADRVL